MNAKETANHIRATMNTFSDSQYDEGRKTLYRIAAYSLENHSVRAAIKMVTSEDTEAQRAIHNGKTFAAGQFAGETEVLQLMRQIKK